VKRENETRICSPPWIIAISKTMEKLVSCSTKSCKRERTMRIDSQALVSRIVAPEATTETRIGSTRIETSHEM